MKAFVERNRNVQIDEPVFNPLKVLFFLNI